MTHLTTDQLSSSEHRQELDSKLMKKKIYGNNIYDSICDDSNCRHSLEHERTQIIEEIHDGFWLYTAPNGFHWTDSTGRNLGRIEYSHSKEDNRLKLEEDEVLHI